MRPKNVHRNIFPNALTSFAAEDRSRDHFNVILLSVCINDNVRWNHQPCRTPSCCQTFDIFLHCGILFNGSVDCEYCLVYNALKDYIWQSNSMLNELTTNMYALWVFGLSRNTGDKGTLGGRWRAKLHIIKHYQNWTLGTYKIFYSVNIFVIVSSLSGDKQ